MKKHELIRRTDAVYNETQNALQTVYDSLNQGQKLKLLKIEAVKTIFDRYTVKY